MNGEQALAKIRSTIQQKIAETPAVQNLIDKINSGKATYADTALYARWAAINLGMCLSGVICDIDLNDRAAVCKALMLDQYRDINGFVDIVQSELDSRFGIQLAPQRAPFNKERADTIGHSLADTTKPDEVIERRAENAVANAVESMHDDRMQAESKFRSRLGLTVVIERTGANCCPWCAEVAGKYRYGDEPEGVFRRHDNCNCTIIYDTQVLRGAVGEDGRRTKTWEEVNPEKVRGFEPDVNTPEQAKALEETALQGLTLPGVRDIMNLNDSIELFTGADKIDDEQQKTLDQALAPIPEKLLTQLSEYVSEITIEDGRGYSSYNRVTHKITLDKATGANSLIHELGHAFGDMLGLYSDPVFLDILADGLNCDNWYDVSRCPHPYTGEDVWILPADKFISDYQGRIYADISNVDWSAPIELQLFREYISVAFNAYFYNPELLKSKDPRLYQYLEEKING